MTANRRDELSKRELQVLILYSRGFDAPEIATKLVINRQTVNSHRKGAVRKLGAKNIVNAVYIGFQKGLLL